MARRQEQRRCHRAGCHQGLGEGDHLHREPAAGDGRHRSQAPVDQTTGKTGSVQDAIRDTHKAYQYAQDNLHTYQTWGRTIDFEVVEASGADETAQRADATAIAAKRPFIVFDQTRWATGGAPALASALAAKKILTFSGSTTPEIGKAQDPYRWANSTDPPRRSR